MNYKTIILSMAIFAQVSLLALKAAGCYWPWWIISSPALTGLAYIATVLIAAAVVNRKQL
jgi:hypothetical protein